MVTKESIAAEAAEIAEKLKNYETADANYKQEYAAFAKQWSEMLAFAKRFAAMTQAEQEIELEAINRMQDKMQSGI